MLLEYSITTTLWIGLTWPVDLNDAQCFLILTLIHLPKPKGSCLRLDWALFKRRFLEIKAVPPGWNFDVETSCAL